MVHDAAPQRRGGELGRGDLGETGRTREQIGLGDRRPRRQPERRVELLEGVVAQTDQPVLDLAVALVTVGGGEEIDGFEPAAGPRQRFRCEQRGLRRGRTFRRPPDQNVTGIWASG